MRDWCALDDGRREALSDWLDERSLVAEEREWTHLDTQPDASRRRYPASEEFNAWLEGGSDDWLRR